MREDARLADWEAERLRRLGEEAERLAVRRSVRWRIERAKRNEARARARRLVLSWR